MKMAATANFAKLTTPLAANSQIKVELDTYIITSAIEKVTLKI